MEICRIELINSNYGVASLLKVITIQNEKNGDEPENSGEDELVQALRKDVHKNNIGLVIYRIVV